MIKYYIFHLKNLSALFLRKTSCVFIALPIKISLDIVVPNEGKS